MDKKAIKTFAIESRKKLIEEVRYRASLLGITAKGIAEPVEKAEGMEVYDIGASNPNTIYDEAIKQRKNLVKSIIEKGFDNVVEEVAYTWFNRIIAIRFMEVNDYLPTRERVLSSEKEGKIEPDIVTEAPHIDIDFTQEEIEQVHKLKNDNRLDELFKLLFIKQCNILNEILPELFEKTADYTELLLSISFTNEEGVVRQLIDNITEEDFKDQVEIIGWLYQYYITELNDLVYDGSFKKNKIPKELLPAATQLFTPDWPVKYMVENSLGRLWLETHPNDIIQNNWKYLIDENFSITEISPEKSEHNHKKLDPKSITVFDPCMGSGHILIYAFDLLMDMYRSAGYNEREAARLILENNIFGVDIDDRAYQLAYFSLLMKARKYNRRIFDEKIKLNLCSIKESNTLSKESINQICNDNLLKIDLEYIINIFKDAKEYGSILNIKNLNFIELYNLINIAESKSFENLYDVIYSQNTLNQLYFLIKQAELLSKKYDVVLTNPPYLNSVRFDVKLSNYIKKNFPDTKTDFVTVFFEKILNSFCKENGFASLISTTSWMFLKKFEKFRKDVIKNAQFVSIVDFGTELFEGKVGHNPIVAWVNKNTIPRKKLIAIKLSEYNYSKRNEKESQFFNESNKFYINQENFSKIPGSPIAYWVSENIANSFEKPKLGDYSQIITGMTTGNNEKFLRFWYEINLNKISLNEKKMVNVDLKTRYWLPYNKGGSRRNWYGNNEYIVNWSKKNEFNRSKTTLEHLYLREGVTWPFVTSGTFSARYFGNGFLWDVAGSPCFFDDSDIMLYSLGFLASKIADHILNIINPTINVQAIDLEKLPLILSEMHKNEIISLVKKNIEISKNDWDSFETSWDFEVHPLISQESLIQHAFERWDELTKKRLTILKDNEERLNEIFIEIYNLQKDLNPKLKNSDIVLAIAHLSRDIKSFISYAVGCMFGRYSLDEDGLIFAGGTWDPSKYSKFLPDDDNIIPILDTEYFEDDIVGRFIEFVKVSFGEENLEENLDFIASALKKKGSTSRVVIRNYFLNDFYKDHVQIYKKRPTYWLFDSGKNNSFKALIYMHRYESDLVARLRTDYLHKTQKAIETAIASHERIIENPTSASEKSKAVKVKDKLIKQLEETRKYDIALAHLANQKIEINLDDGVKVNYANFQGVEVSSEGRKVKKIDLLKKI